MYSALPRVQVGCYDPMSNSSGEVVVGLNFERIKWEIDKLCFNANYWGFFSPARYWLSVGAQPTVPVYKLLGLVSSAYMTLAMCIVTWLSCDCLACSLVFSLFIPASTWRQHELGMLSQQTQALQRVGVVHLTLRTVKRVSLVNKLLISLLHHVIYLYV